MNYCEALPSPLLAGSVHCFWFLSGEASASPEIVCPDGRAELVFNLAEPLCRVGPDGTLERQQRSFVVGQMVSPMQLVATASFRICGIRFKHDGAWPILGDQQEFAGRTIAAVDVWGRQAETLREQLSETDSIPAMVQLLERFLQQRLNGDSDTAVSQAILFIRQSGGTMPVGELARRSGWSERQFQRRFHACVGLSPKVFSRVIRFQRALRLMDREEPLSAALACGYFDQAHFIREFRALAGTTPVEYWRRIHPLSVFYNTLPPAGMMMNP